MLLSLRDLDLNDPIPRWVHQAAEVVDSRAYSKGLLMELRVTRKRDRRRLITSKLLINPRVHLGYVVRGLARHGTLFEQRIGDVFCAAHSFNPYLASNETALVIERHRRGKQRMLLEFGPLARARQLLVRDIIRELHPARPDQFAGQGGVLAALRAVNTAISRGFIYGVELDVRDFYPSVEIGHLLATLRHVPSRVTENVVWTDEDVSLIGRDGSPYRATAIGSNSRSPRGLAQGSAVSVIAAETLLAAVFDGLPTDVVIVNYADNVFVLGVTKDAVAAACDYLAAKLAGLPSGPLEFKALGRAEDVRVGLSFLGFEGDFCHFRGRILWRPGQAALDEIETEIEATDSTEARVIKAIRRVKAWHDACPDWPHRQLHACTYLAELYAKLVPYSGSSAIQISEYAERLWQISGNPLPLSISSSAEMRAVGS